MNSTTKPSIIPEAAAGSAATADEGWLTRLARKGLLDRLARLRRIVLRLAGGLLDRLDIHVMHLVSPF